MRGRLFMPPLPYGRVPWLCSGSRRKTGAVLSSSTYSSRLVDSFVPFARSRRSLTNFNSSRTNCDERIVWVVQNHRATCRWEKWNANARAMTWSDCARQYRLTMSHAITLRPCTVRNVEDGSAMLMPKTKSGIDACCPGDEGGEA
jgi:hypothetical protein